MAIKTFTTEVLTSADTNTYLANSGLVYVTSATVGTGVASTTVSNCFSATYDSYKIIFTGGTGTANVNLTFAFNGSPAGWFGNLMYADFASGAPTSIGYNNLTIITYAGGVSSSTPELSLEIHNPFLAKPSYASSAYFDGVNAGTSTAKHSASTSYTGFIVAISGANTLTGGTITVYGYRKA